MLFDCIAIAYTFELQSFSIGASESDQSLILTFFRHKQISTPMKTKNTLFAAALTGMLLSGSAFTSNAQNNLATADKSETTSEKLSVVQVKPMQFRVSYITPQSKIVAVRILDTDKNVLFSENRRTDSNYLKYFDLSTLMDGTYTFEITDGKEKYAQSFDILTKTSRVVSSIN
ncbi:hypothetical protein DYBT9275_01140 [Dyadobacter sp. CECT 9275]|uniref:Por secretion system C-terminal sorting domain-containing protein n=2 Tax=Dyadobacter helix TaxID=2822344 RepID=A0A916JBH1_9BACT|nr:hypothetical protein DYBT9275_01140 [Dyadobacter sp. CECT 9275]